MRRDAHPPILHFIYASLCYNALGYPGGPCTLFENRGPTTGVVVPHELHSNQPLLQIRNLRTTFDTDQGVAYAVDGVDFAIAPGEIFAMVGESGCGKTVTALSILGLIDPPGKVVSGEIIFQGRELTALSKAEMDALRGDQITMIFQEPLASLNPVFSIGAQIGELLRVHRGLSRREARREGVALLEMVGIPDAEARLQAYPDELSGGQAQRVMIAMALALNPALLIADEPTTALDVTIQAQILELLRSLKAKHKTAVLLITHDLGVVAEMADQVAVMYAGQIVESAGIDGIFSSARHPYTQALLHSMPALGKSRTHLPVIAGTVPNPLERVPGCRFAPRCEARRQYHLEICRQREPDLISSGVGHAVRCWLYQSANGHEKPLNTVEQVDHRSQSINPSRREKADQ